MDVRMREYEPDHKSTRIPDINGVENKPLADLMELLYEMRMRHMNLRSNLETADIKHSKNYTPELDLLSQELHIDTSLYRPRVPEEPKTLWQKIRRLFDRLIAAI